MREIAAVLSDYCTSNVNIIRCANVSGGDIHQSFHVEYLVAGVSHHVFIKSNSEHYAPLLEAEAQALRELESSGAIKTPVFQGVHCANGKAYLFLEWLALKNHGDEFALGCQLARLHQTTKPQFGWSKDNYIGFSPQRNGWGNNWCDYWITCRLLPQLAMAHDKNYGHKVVQYEQPLIAVCEALLSDHQPKASLLHGDFWGGNKAFLADGRPVIFDPASYYGDREVDLAMAGLFGGFTQDFYDGYNTVLPLEHGFKKRKLLYNLYHLLNHLNMFGSSYIRESLSAIQTLIADQTVS